MKTQEAMVKRMDFSDSEQIRRIRNLQRHNPRHGDWRRRVNLLLYLNPGWRDEWGGQLALWDRTMAGRLVRASEEEKRAQIEVVACFRTACR